MPPVNWNERLRFRLWFPLRTLPKETSQGIGQIWRINVIASPNRRKNAEPVQTLGSDSATGYVSASPARPAAGT